MNTINDAARSRSLVESIMMSELIRSQELLTSGWRRRFDWQWFQVCRQMTQDLDLLFLDDIGGDDSRF
jgi:hypothetical protein